MAPKSVVVKYNKMADDMRAKAIEFASHALVRFFLISFPLTD